MGGTDNDYYQGQTHKIQGTVVGALENAKVTLYLDDKSEPIAKADVESDGSYVLEFTPEVHENIDKNNYALLVANDANKSYRGIVVFYDSNSSDGYSYKDTTISAYTDSVYKVKSSLKFENGTTTSIIDNLKINFDLNNSVSKDASIQEKVYQKGYGDCLAEIYQHNAWASATDFHEKWSYKATRTHVSFRQSNLNFIEFSQSYRDFARAYWIRWKVEVDVKMTILLTDIFGIMTTRVC